MNPRFFIHDALDVEACGETLRGLVVNESVGGKVGAYLDGILEVPEFLSPEGRQYLEGQIFAYGQDFRKSYRTVDSAQCPDEITISAPESQIPVVGEFVQEFRPIFDALLPWRFRRCVYQLRIYEPRYGGHPEHVDYAPGFSVSGIAPGQVGITSVSLSLPISWNNGEAPEFVLNWRGSTIRQTQPGSLILFGPRIPHAHPMAPSLLAPYAWLIAQAFYDFDLGQLDDR